MKKRIPVSQIMSTKMVTASIHDDLRAVRDLMRTNHIRHMPVVSGTELVGIISHTDIMRLSFGNLFDGQHHADEAVFDMLKLDQVMVKHPKTVTADETIKEVAEYLTTAEFHALPVVNGKDLVGIVTTTDVIRYLLEQYN